MKRRPQSQGSCTCKENSTSISFYSRSLEGNLQHIAKRQRMEIGDIELVEKVFLKLVLAETDDQFQSSLNGFLAPILLKLASRNDQVKNKILELLTHINRRLKSRPKIELPLVTLLKQYQDDKVPPTIWNFTIIYIKMAYQRTEKAQQINLIPELFSCLIGRSTQHQDVLIQCILFHINDIFYPENIEERKRLFSFVKNTSVLDIVLDYFVEFILLPYTMELNMNDPAAVAPPSLNKTLYKRLKTDPIMTSEQIELAKLGIIKFIGSEIFLPKDIVPLLIIAASDSRHSVSDKAEHMLKKFASVELWENIEVMAKLLRYYQGPLKKPGNLHDTKHSSDMRSPSSKRLKMKVFPYFLKSKRVVDLNPPLCLQMIFEGLFGDDVISRIKHFSLEFIHHTCFYCSTKTMNFMGPLFYQAVYRVAFDKKEELKLRSLAFSGFSKIARRSTEIFKKDIALVQKLFTSLEEESADIRLSIQDVLSSISSAYSGLKDANVKVMETLILSCIEKENPSLRFAAVQFSNAVFPSTHMLSRYVCLLCVGDSKDDIREEAMRGLSKSKSLKVTSDTTTKFYPDYCEACDYLYSKILERKSKFKVDTLIFPVAMYAKLLVYLRECLHENSGITDEDVIKGKYLVKLNKFLLPLIHVAGVEDVFQLSVGRHISILKDSLIPTAGYALHSVAINNLLELVAAVPEKLSNLFSEHLNWLQCFLCSPKEEVRESSARLLSIIICTFTPTKLQETISKSMGQLNSKVFEEVHGSILLLGFTLSRHSSLQKQLNIEPMETDSQIHVEMFMKDYLSQFIRFLCSKLKDTNVLMSSACCVAIGEICRQFSLPIPDRSENSENISKERILSELSSLLYDAPETKIKEKAAKALGNICVGDVDFIFREQLIEKMIASAKIRQPELHFTVGEAFSCIAAGALSQAAEDEWSITNANTLTSEPNDHMAEVLQKIIKECINSTVSYIRQAGVIWLLCIIKFSAGHPGLQKEINEVQTAFINLLSDSDDVTQDVASRGLGLVYDLVKTENKDDLVAILVDRLMSGKRPKQNVEAETEIFKPGTLGSSPDGANLSTYKELCSLATSMNRPDLMYKFMNLANHNAMWNSRKGAAFGFLSIASLAGEHLKPYLSEIIPKLYRYQYDPNPGVQRAMSNIWSALVPDGKRTVDKYLKEILKDILSNITSSTWRTRESCCLALNDLIRTSSAEDIAEQLPELWSVAFRVMDDIKESVRKAATVLSKTLSRLSIRICDVNQSKLGEQAVGAVLPVLLEAGLSSRVAEVKEISLQTLVLVTRNAGSLLKPHIPKFVIALLESLSGLEPQYLNTLSLQLSQSQEAQDKLDVLRLSASKSSPMMEAVNFCVQYVDETVLEDLIPMLCSLLKTGLGLGTKVGCSTLVIQLTLQCRNQLTPFAGKLLAALLNGMNDRNNAIRKAYAVSIGHLIRYAKESSIEKVLNRLNKWYLEKEDETIHFSCAWCINCMAKYSPDTFYNYGSLAMPLVFVAMQGEKDVKGSSDNGLQEVWEEIWNNNTSGNTSAIKLYLSEIYVLVEPLFGHHSWTLRIKAARAVMSVAESLGSSLYQPHLSKFINLLLTGLQGRTWTGKEILLRALSTIYVKCRSTIMDSVDETTPSIDTVVLAFIKECRKENLSYKRVAIEYSTLVIEEWEIDQFADYKPIISALIDYDAEDDEEDKKKIQKEETSVLAFDTLGRVWPRSVEPQRFHLEFVIDTLLAHITNSTWKTQVAICKAAVAFIDRTHWNSCLELANEKNQNIMERFVNSFVPLTCACMESSSYASVKLNGIKVLKAFFTKAQENERLLCCLEGFKPRIVQLINQLSSSTNFDVTNNVVELMKLIALRSKNT